MPICIPLRSLLLAVKSLSDFETLQTRLCDLVQKAPANALPDTKSSSASSEPATCSHTVSVPPSPTFSSSSSSSSESSAAGAVLDLTSVQACATHSMSAQHVLGLNEMFEFIYEGKIPSSPDQLPPVFNSTLPWELACNSALENLTGYSLQDLCRLQDAFAICNFRLLSPADWPRCVAATLRVCLGLDDSEIGRAHV